MAKLSPADPPISSALIAPALLLIVAACSSSDPETADGPSQATPANTPANTPEPGTPADEDDPSGSSDPLPSGSDEGPPTDVNLTMPPGSATGGPSAPPAQTPDQQGEETPTEPGGPIPSAGCASASEVASGRFSIDVAGNPRDYILALPQGYDAARPYPLVFTWHPGGGTAQGTANNYYGLRQLAEDSAIFVSPEGIDNGWANTGGRDIAFLDAMLERFEAELCIDQSRIFSTGFSYGGMMSFAIGCARADVFRAIAPMAGALYSGCPDGDAPIAMLGFHGTEDTVVPLENGIRARNVIAERNGCQPAAIAIEANGCVTFQGCSEGHPVTWCEFDGGHTPAPQSAAPIWDFFSGF